MKTEFWWIDGAWPGKLAIAPRPRGGDWLGDEVLAWRQAGLDWVVSLLTPEEVDEFNLAQEVSLCQVHGLRFVAFPIDDRGVPSSRNATRDLVRQLDRALMDGKNIAVHCRQGIGRSAMLAACLLVSVGIDPETAFEKLRAARGCPVPETPEQRKWVLEFARKLAVSLPSE